MASFIRIASAAARMLREHTLAAGEVQPAPPPPPSSRSERVLSSAGYWGFNAALLVSAALVLGFLRVGSNIGWLGWLKLVLGVAMVLEGLLLLSDWRGGRRLLLQRIERRLGAGGGKRVFLPRLLRNLTSLVLQLLGLAWLGGGTLAAARGVEQIL